MTDMECTGNEMSLEDCPHTSGNITCSRNEGAGVECNGYDGIIEKLQIGPESIHCMYLEFNQGNSTSIWLAYRKS